MKRGKLLLIVSVMVILSVSLTSAGFFSNFYDKITGKATSDTTALNITVGNSVPTITIVDPIAATDPSIGTTKSITFYFNVTDTDGYANIDIDTAKAYFTKAGESTRSNTSCISTFTPNSGNSMNFTCTIDMWYWDENGAWTINVTIEDINSAVGYNESETFTYNLQTAMTMSPTSLGWPTIGLTDTDTGSDEDPITANNSGNDVNLNINVTALDLQGEETTTQYIYANNFTVEDATEGCSGTVMVNATSTNVTSAILQRGNNSLNYNNATSGQEQIFFCLKGVPQDISAQSYSSSAYGPWTVEIVT